MSYRLHPTKNKNLKPGEKKYYQITTGRDKDRETHVLQFENDRQAQIYDNELKRAYRPQISTLIAPTFEEILPNFLNWYTLHRQPRSVEAWLTGWNNLTPMFAKLKPNHLSPELIDQYKLHRLSQKAGIRKNNVCKRTVAKELANLSAIIKYAVEHNHCDPLPFKIKGFAKKQVKPPQKVIPPPDKIALMLEKCRSDVRPLYKLIYYAGLRNEEARTLKARDIDLDNNIIRVVGKGDKQRIVPIAVPLRPILEQELAGKKPDDILMLSHRTGKPYTSNIGRLDGAAKQAGITSHISCHTLRHCFGTHAIYWGISQFALKDIMGHEELSTSDIYVTLASTFISSEMKRFGGNMAAPPPGKPSKKAKPRKSVVQRTKNKSKL